MTVLRAVDPLASTREVLAFWNASLGASFPLDERLWRQQIGLEKDERILLAAFEAGSAAASARAGSEPGVAGGGADPATSGSAAARTGVADAAAGPPPAGPQSSAPPHAAPAIGELTAGLGDVKGLALVKRAVRPGPDGAVPAKGNLSFILVERSSRGRGLGRALLDGAEGWLRARGAARLYLGRDTYHFFPGAPLDEEEGFVELLGLLGSRGFAPEGDEHDLIADLGELDMRGLAAKVKRAEGYRTLAYEGGQRAALDRFFRANFPGRWRSDTFEAIDAGMRGSDLLVLREEASGEIVGFSRVYDRMSPVLGPGVYWRALMGDRPCGLGPIGVDESRRGLGLGLRLLYDSMAELAGRGCRTMVIDWTDLVDFYGKMGFGIWKSYRLMAKAL